MLIKGSAYFNFARQERLLLALIGCFSERLVNRAPKNVSEDCHIHLESAEPTLNSLTTNRWLVRLIKVNGCSIGDSFQSKRVELFVSFSELFKTNLDVTADEGLIKTPTTGIFFHLWFGAINGVVAHCLNGGASPFTGSLRIINEVLVDGLFSTSKQARYL